MTRPHPAIDLVTGSAALIVQKRPLVPLTRWIADAIGAAAEAGLPLQIVTPHDARLTMPLHSLLQPPLLRWVAGHPDGFYDGLSGEPLDFDGSWFVPVDPGRRTGPFLETPEGADGVRLMLSFRVRHPASESTVLGAATEAAYRLVTGAGPSGCGTGEPVARTWNADDITALCRERAPQGTRFCHTGAAGAIGTTHVTRNTEGVDEEVALHAGYRAGQDVPVERVAVLVEELAAGHHLVDVQAQVRPGRPDLTAVPHWTGPSAPIGMALGPASVREIGRERALDFPRAVPLGPGRFPAVWYPLGDGRTDGTAEAAWTVLDELVVHLGPGDQAPENPSRSAPTRPAEPLREGIWRGNRER
ncbi:DUF6177 family protein [Spirillospora sp. NBC_01491]|uniref:DUF6177 family protein n=1 Tax=Spirillospora sp. NBC_01491 TaxID=2976007 RepID=UPI002E2EC7AD|nr:DUF6177 family protein [Spirillospora sp. NBC_01491]